jgi:CelD/BcsL family acetyltransferase involved in cellulose biosynthesis
MNVSIRSDMTLVEVAVRSRAPATNDALAITVATSFEDAGLSREEWDEFVLDVGGDVYSSYDWCRIWWRHYGQGRKLRLFVFRQENRLVGLAPMFIERLWLGPVAIRIAKRVSSDFAMDVFALPVSTKWSNSIYSQIVSRLVETEKCDAVWFGFLPSEDPSLASLRGVAAVRGGPVVLARDAEVGVHTCFHLPDGFDAYVVGLERSARQNYRRRLNLLKKTFDVKQGVVSDPTDPLTEFRAFRAFHTKQWEAEGKPGHFGDWPNSDAFNQDLVTQFAKLGRFRMLHLYADGSAIATQYAFTFGPNCYWRLPARTTEKDMGRFGLGVLGLMQLLEQMSHEGIRRIEAGPGHYDYKVQYGGRESGYLSILVKSTRPSSSLRVHLFTALSDLTHFLYYRVWRKRIAPHQPLRSGSLWRTWIRLRV